MIKLIKGISAITLCIAISGCSQKSVRTSINVQKQQSQYNYGRENLQRENQSYRFQFKPVIGTKQEDTKVYIDMGQFAKIWVKNYRNKNETFVASHNIITMIKQPGFIAGEDLPTRRNKTIRQTYGAKSFAFKSDDVLYKDGSADNSDVSTQEIKEYVNNVKYSQRYNKVTDKKQASVNKYDETIKEFLKDNN